MKLKMKFLYIKKMRVVVSVVPTFYRVTHLLALRRGNTYRENSWD